MNLGKTGVGYITPAMFPIPQNPVTIAWNAYEAAKSKGVSGLGMFVPALFAEPENPITRGTKFNTPKQLSRPEKNVLIDSMQRAKFTGPMGSGMGSLDITSLQAFENSLMSDKSFGVSNVVLVGAGALAIVLLMSGKGRR